MTTNSSPSNWWKNSVIYQIYPRSFCDSNGDGIGDIPGITSKLDYLADLGIDAIWLSPIFQSPMHDFGYDISDYRAIDPVFGTIDDFKTLIGEAKSRGIRIILDGVFNHSSHEHPWFVESRSSIDNPKRDWYIWRKKRNNWLSIFGGRAWEYDDTTQEYYLHSFLKEQPDLNWRNPEVKEAVFAEIKYWLEMGVAGFRFDVINFFFKDERFRNNPLGIGPTPRPYDWQKHIHDRDLPDLHELLQEMRTLFDQYDAMMVGEIFSEVPKPDLSASFLGAGDELHLAFDFSLMYTSWSATKFTATLRAYHNAISPKAWPCTVLSNHDQPRSLTRFGNVTQPEKAKLLAVLLLTTKGTPFIYYGDEIGMVDAPIKRAQIVDPVGKKYWPFHKGRDPARSPMQWTDRENAGFSAAAPWLPVHPKFSEINAEKQVNDPNSVWSTYQRLNQLRKQYKDLREGDMTFLPQSKHSNDIVAYQRGELTITINFGTEKQSLELDKPSEAIFMEGSFCLDSQSQTLELAACSAVILR